MKRAFARELEVHEKGTGYRHLGVGRGGSGGEMKFGCCCFPSFLLAMELWGHVGSVPVMRQGSARTPVLAATREAS